MGAAEQTPNRPAIAWSQVLSAMLAVAALLSVYGNQYGWHRDELYFRMLKPGWGYVDQGPLTPLIIRFFSQHVADEPWAIHIPSTVNAMLSILVVVLITRELGGGRHAQTLCAWAFGFATTPLVFGHVMLTSSLDLFVWPLVTLFIMRALLRGEPHWWLLAGVVVGLSMYNKLLIAMLLVAYAAALALVGPRRPVFRSAYPIGAGLLALVIGAPNIIYQATNSWPELSMGQALADHNAGDVHALLLPYTIILFGPPLAVVWAVGLVALWRRPSWRPVRFLAVAFPILLVLVYIAGTQFYYPSGLLEVLIAAGCVPVAEYVDGSMPWRVVLIAALAVNAAVSAPIGLPVIPVTEVGSTPVPDINITAADSVGWPAYVRQIARVYDDLPPAQRASAVVVTSNYGEAGAVARFGPAHGIDTVYSPHNELYFQSRPPAATTLIVMVGGELPDVRREFRTCTVEARLHNGVGVDNEEQGQPIAVCQGPLAGWTEIWASLQHYD